MADKTEFEYLPLMIRQVVETKRTLGLSIHSLQYPHLCEQLDIPLVAYVNKLIDDVIELRKEEYKALKGKNLDYYGVLQLLRVVFKDERRAFEVWSVICHKVSACPAEVLDYCERVLREAGKPVPERPQKIQSNPHPIGAE